MLRAIWLFVAVIVISATPAPSLAGACGNKPFCFETSDYAFRVMLNSDPYVYPDAEKQQSLHKLDPWPQSLFRYLVDHPGEVIYRACAIPLPEKHAIQIGWNLGLVLSSGEVIWATQWLIPSTEMVPCETAAPWSLLLNTSLLKPMSGNRYAYNLYVAFPTHSPGGTEWSVDDVEGLTLDNADNLVIVSEAQ